MTKKASAIKADNRRVLGIPRGDRSTNAFQFFIKHVRTATVKRRVASVLFSIVSLEIFFLSVHPHYEIGWLEIAETSFVCCVGMILYFTDVHRHFLSLSAALYTHVELNGFDRFQYIIADTMKQISSRVRKTQTGALSSNMLLLLLGMALLLFLLLFAVPK